MLNSRRYKILRLLLCSVLLFWLMNFVYYLKSTDVSLFKENISAERKLLWTQEEENGRIEDLRLKKKENEVPVVIVDQHQEVIPYWFKAVDEGLIPRQGNMLIHVDGHSDMGTPDKYRLFKKFQYVENMNQVKYFPLMQSNDVFIVSAVMAGLIDKIIWVQPDWNDDSNRTEINVAYVGLYKGDSQLCLCLKKVRKSKNKTRHYLCTVSGYNSTENDPEIEIHQPQCKLLQKFAYYLVSESNFAKVLNFNKPRSVILDIDEDHFGVESGVKKFIEQGISLETQDMLDPLLSELYCPKSTTDELLLHYKMQSLFFSVHNYKVNGQTNILQTLHEEILKHTKDLVCDKSLVENFAHFMVQIDKKEIKALSKARFCLYDSPRLRQSEEKFGEKSGSEYGFSLCHGTIYPADTLNQIHVGTTEEIDKRASVLKDILKHISSFVKPSIYTICRSLRDGYTPRHQQRYIERNVLRAVTEVTRENGQKENIIYDSQLVFGREGWLNDV